MWDTELAKI
jgi:serine/threonine-protein kinase mTOR